MPPPKDDKLESLLDEGFSKGRAIQALKDSGRSLEVARRILATQKAHPAAVSKTAACAPVKVLEPASPSALHSPPALPTRVRRHPCIVQYKECFFGDRCLLKDLPGDICIHHYWGKCLHGSSCGNPHYVNGVNLKQIRLNKEHEQREMLATQLHPCIVQHNYCHYGAHCYMMDLPGDICMHHFWGTCSFKSGCRNSHSVDGVDLQQMRVQIEKERSMSYNAEHDNSWENGSRESPQEDLFAFQARRQHVDPSPTACAEDPAQIGGGGGPSSRPTPFLDAFKALPSSQEAPWQPHRAKDGSREPCASTGEFNYPCLNYQQCYFHHERNHGGPLYNDRPTASSTTNPPPYSECVASMPPLLQEQETPSDERDTGDDAAVPEPPSPHLSADCLPPDDVTDDANIGSPATSIDVDAEFNGEWMASEPMLFSGAEMESFSTLCETYPHISPSLVRDTLRSTGGDVHRAAETLHTIFYAAQADGTENDDALAAVLAEEEDKAEEVLQSEKRCSALLNLCYLFPTIEVSVIESVLTRCDGDTSDAYFALFSRHNGITIKSSNRSTSLESLRNANSAHVVSLLQRYPHIAEEVVISVFEATGKNLKLTAEALNQYSTETMSLMKERSMRATGSAPFLMPQLPRPASQLPQGSMVPTEISPDCADACRKAQEEYGDWRSIRRRAYDVNRFRIQMQSRAASSIGSRETQRLLIKEASRLGAEYERLNHLAKLALELERSAGDSSLLDLHGFHTDEILDVVQRRIQTCCKRRVSSLSIVTGEGNHSKNGRPKLFPTLLELLRTDAYLKSKIEKFSAGSGVVKVRIRNS